jgi:hypothetical protein
VPKTDARSSEKVTLIAIPRVYPGQSEPADTEWGAFTRKRLTGLCGSEKTYRVPLGSENGVSEKLFVASTAAPVQA